MQEVITVPAVTDEMIRDIVQCVVERYAPHKIVIFGSRAYGKPRPESDLDLLVVLDSQDRPAERSARVVQACRPKGIAMDVLVRTPREIAERLAAGDPFFCEVMERGKVLYERAVC